VAMNSGEANGPHNTDGIGTWNQFEVGATESPCKTASLVPLEGAISFCAAGGGAASLAGGVVGAAAAGGTVSVEGVSGGTLSVAGWRSVAAGVSGGNGGTEASTPWGKGGGISFEG
jgi:hypothetical protein